MIVYESRDASAVLVMFIFTQPLWTCEKLYNGLKGPLGAAMRHIACLLFRLKTIFKEA